MGRKPKFVKSDYYVWTCQQKISRYLKSVSLLLCILILIISIFIVTKMIAFYTNVSVARATADNKSKLSNIIIDGWIV